MSSSRPGGASAGASPPRANSYRLRPSPEGAELEAEVSVGGGKGLGGRILAQATGALLTAVPSTSRSAASATRAPRDD